MKYWLNNRSRKRQRDGMKERERRKDKER